MKNTELFERARASGAFCKSFILLQNGRTVHNFIDLEALFAQPSLIMDFANEMALQISDGIELKGMSRPDIIATAGRYNFFFAQALAISLIQTIGCSKLRIVNMFERNRTLFVQPECPPWMKDESNTIVLDVRTNRGETLMRVADAARSLGGRVFCEAAIFNQEKPNERADRPELIALFDTGHLTEDVFVGEHRQWVRLNEDQGHGLRPAIANETLA